MDALTIIQFTSEQYSSWRNLIFMLGLAVGFALGGCVIFIAHIILGKYDEERGEKWQKKECSHKR